jgi:hypothetical protein
VHQDLSNVDHWNDIRAIIAIARNPIEWISRRIMDADDQVQATRTRRDLAQ